MKAFLRKETGIFVLLVVLCAFASIRNPRFLGPENLHNLANLVGIYGIFSIGAGLVIITSGIDLSVGSSFALLGVFLAMDLNENHWPPMLAIGVVLLAGVCLGLMHAFLITKMRMQPFIVTLCGLLFYRGWARYISGDSSKGFGDAKGFEWLRDVTTGSISQIPFSGKAIITLPTPIPNTFLMFVVIAAIMWVVLHRSVWGRHLFASGQNEEAAKYSGIHATRIIGSAYVLAAFFTAISAILLAFYTNEISASNHGSFYELYGIAAAVLGGCSLRGGEGSIIGIALGTILLLVLQNLVNLLGIPSSLNYAVMGGVILLGVLADQIISTRSKQRRAA